VSLQQQAFDWVRAKASSPHSELWIGIAGLLETLLFFPVDPFIIVFTLERPAKYLRYAAVATMASAIGATIAYTAGACTWHLIGDFILTRLISPSFFNQLVAHYELHQHAVIFAGAFLPLPFKAITLSAGFCKLSFSTFISCITAARAARFTLVAWSVQRWGDKIKCFIDRYSSQMLALVCVKVTVLAVLFYFWK
jgi:membrane protein YqaA with SNARE-associated domain